jgi:virginiamycin A acetyltransferase
MENRIRDELRCSCLSGIIFQCYRYNKLRRICVYLAKRLEGGDFYSKTLRRILQYYHGVIIGAYSYGECMIPGYFPAGVTVGRYVSIGPGVRIFLRNHPLDRLSMHPFFYNAILGWVEEDTISSGSLEIGHDAWIGANVIVTRGCSRIGIGAVVGAGTIITKDVADFAVVVGNPGRQIGSRFTEDTCELILQSKWWDRPISECGRFMSDMIKPLGAEPQHHPLLIVNHVDGER